MWIGQKVGGVRISQDSQKMAPPIPPINGLKTLFRIWFRIKDWNKLFCKVIYM